MWVVAWIIYGAHWLLTFFGFGDGPGVAWVISLVLLTVIIRAIMIPLFFKQIAASRGQQLIQPEIKAIQDKYKDKKDPASREAMSRETMALYKEHGTNPFSSCLPMLLQTPVFFALFQVLNALGPIARGERPGIGPITQQIADDIQRSTLFGAHLSDVFTTTTSTTSRVVVILLILAMSASTFYTQKQLTQKNMPEAALQGQAASMQKIMLYGMPLFFGISGINFPVGVLIYWTVTNIWSMGQQWYSIKHMPTPGSIAEEEMKAKKIARAAAKGVVLEPQTGINDVIEIIPGQRQQPRRKNRAKK
jgi:YidC/Oxa1 family membrane protein insertase